MEVGRRRKEGWNHTRIKEMEHILSLLAQKATIGNETASVDQGKSFRTEINVCWRAERLSYAGSRPRIRI